MGRKWWLGVLLTACLTVWPIQTVLADHQYSYHHCDECIWVPGRYDCRTERVCVSGGTYETVWVPGDCGPTVSVGRCGVRFRLRSGAGRYVRRWTPPRYEYRTVRVWVPAYWRCD